MHAGRVKIETCIFGTIFESARFNIVDASFECYLSSFFVFVLIFFTPIIITCYV